MGIASYNEDYNKKLLEFELPEERHLRSSFGYWYMLEKRMYRKELLAEGWKEDDPTFDFEISRRREAARAVFMSYADYQRTVLHPRWAQQAKIEFNEGRSAHIVEFTKAEMEAIAERFAGVNDPVGQAVLTKILSALSQ